MLSKNLAIRDASNTHSYIHTLVKLIFSVQKNRLVVILLCTIKPHIVIEIENDYHPDLHGYL